MPMLTGKQGAHDSSLGIEPNPEGGQAYCSGYYGKYLLTNLNIEEVKHEHYRPTR